MLDLHQLRVLTTKHIAQLYFGCERTALRRLGILCDFGLIWGYRPLRQRGSHPYHFVLLKLGALVVASRLDTDLRGLGWKDDLPTRIAKNRNLRHWRETNGFLAGLAHASRISALTTLVEWEGDRSAARGLPIAPDAIGTLRLRGNDLRFYYEHDRSTENHAQLRAKIERYREASILAGTPRVLLFTFLTEARELQARRDLEVPGILVATAVYDRALADPLGDVWRRIGEPLRTSLISLFPPPGSG